MTENFAGETIFPKNNSGNVLEIPLYPSGYADYYTILNWFVFDNGEWHELTKVDSHNFCTYYGTYSFKTELVSAGPFINVGVSPCYYRIYPDGHVNIAVDGRITQEFVMPPFKNGSVGKAVQTFPISDTSITANSDILMELTDEGGVKAYSMEAGSITVIRDTLPTQPIPYTYKVKQTNASGQFTVINHYTPEIPEVPTNAQIIDLIYPVGSIYMSINSANPSTFLGGTWEAWGAGKVPVGVDTADTDFNAVEKTGGEKTHTLTESEMPAHRHTIEAIGTGTTQQELNAFSVDNQGAIDSYGTTNTAGGGQAHNNLQPYITCYMWKRTA